MWGHETHKSKLGKFATAATQKVQSSLLNGLISWENSPPAGRKLLWGESKELFVKQALYTLSLIAQANRELKQRQQESTD